VIRVALLVTIVAGAFPLSASAECIALSVGTVARHADAIFSGTVTDIGASTITFDVDRVWKGPVTKPLTVYVISSVEPFEPTLGVKYLVLASRASKDDQLRDSSDRSRAFVLRACESGTRRWEAVSDREIKQLGRGRSPARRR
jgi:hypothetical protein